MLNEYACQEHKDAVLRWFLYRLKHTDRACLMADLPAAYNSVVGERIVKVVYVDDGQDVTPQTESNKGNT